ncbi:MAG: SNF2-related protein [Bdellovibrionota bacterium]|nr:SNF2-related protein [Bdellovibrionota bacterium]
MSFEIGQRWLSEAEPELGLGVIYEIGHKIIKMSFPVCEEFRIYGSKSAPLRRAIFHEGEEISSLDGEKLVVEQVIWEEGLAIYKGQDKVIKEADLSYDKILNRPKERLLSGLADSLRSHQLRQLALEQKNRLATFKGRGLMGARLSLIDHQIYVANEIASREIPRVLLADEVGLGKTIEACLIIHYLLIRERAKRILIVVPNSLTYQWFVELLRRFKLSFTIVNQETRLENGENPFDKNDLVITSLGLLKGSVKAQEMAYATPWDLLVVDEAHQLKCTQEEKGPEYDIVEHLSEKTPGLILLTATPEQLGKFSHFSRLRLLDPKRFSSFEDFVLDEKKYKGLASLLEKKEQGRKLLKNDKSLWKEIFPGEQEQQKLSKEQVNKIIDAHGTGRVYIRNMRARIDRNQSLFPKRCLKTYVLDKEGQNEEDQKKAEWLADFLKEKRDEKVLLICQSKKKILFLEQFLAYSLPNLKVAMFHSDLTLLSRDRQAAYFADPDGAQILLCTEIGSEGRNFQFAQDLVLFDLPVSPDLLEQRIGRLDRIGQKGEIFIHVPFLSEGQEEGVFKWLYDGLGAFEKPLKMTYSLFEGCKDELFSFLDIYPKKEKEFSQFLKNVTERKKEMEKEIENGRDKLIEMNSFDEEKGSKLVSELELFNKENDLKAFMEEVFHNFGVDFEDLDERGDDYFIRPSSNMFIPYFPELLSDGMTITFSRERALEREDIHFLTWDHPMVTGILDLILGGEMGNVSVVVRKKRKKEALYLECNFWLECHTPKKWDAERFFPPTELRALIDLTGQDLGEKWSVDFINNNVEELKKDFIHKAIPLLRKNVPEMIKSAEKKVTVNMEDYIRRKTDEMNRHLDGEILRLEELKAKNLSVREEEIQAYINLKQNLEKSFKEASLSLDSLRVIF